ncbi:hypothetical protein P154DRAFT_393950, partial [Amniculicola lignicola CBS 123094]
PSCTTIMKEAASMDLVPRFYHLFNAAEKLIHQYGPYTISTSGILTRNPKPNPHKPIPWSSTEYAASFATAQKATNAPQPSGPERSDLEIFNLLWATTITLMDAILISCELNVDTFGWGIYGLCAGYRDPTSPFSSMKERLYNALRALPNLDKPKGEQAEKAVPPANRVSVMVKARGKIHVTANLLLQGFRRDWGRVGWYYGICVAERWVRHLG